MTYDVDVIQTAVIFNDSRLNLKMTIIINLNVCKSYVYIKVCKYDINISLCEYCIILVFNVQASKGMCRR